MRRSARQPIKRRVIAVTALVLALLMLAPSAHADPPVAQGWWWIAQREALPIPAVGPVGQVTEQIPQQAGPSGVPDDGLYVAGSAAGDEAVATLRFFVREGAKPLSLDLVVAGESTGTPLIRLCSVTTQWTPTQRGTWDARPTFECADDAPVGVPSEDGKMISFDLSGRNLVGTVDFGLAPGVEEQTGAPATFQTAFEKPGGDALRIEGGSGADVPAFSPPPTDGGGSSAPTSPVTMAEIPQVPAAVGGFNPTPVATQAPAAPSVGGGTSEFAAPATSPLPMVPASSGNDLRTFGMVGLLALAGFYAWLTGQQSREPSSLLVFGRGSSGPVIDAEVLR